MTASTSSGYALVGGRELARALRQVLPAVGSDRKRPALQGVLLETVDGSLRLVATDARRLAVRELTTATSSAPVRALVPGDALDDLVAWMEAAEEVGIATQAGLVSFTAGGEVRSAPTLDLEFPDVEPLLAARPDQQRAVVQREALLGALDRLPDAPFAHLRFASDALTITVEDVAETVAVTYDGDGLELAVDPDLLLDAVVAVEGLDLALDVSTPVAPIAMTGVVDASITYLVMPVRTTAPAGG